MVLKDNTHTYNYIGAYVIVGFNVDVNVGFNDGVNVGINVGVVCWC